MDQIEEMAFYINSLNNTNIIIEAHYGKKTCSNVYDCSVNIDDFNRYTDNVQKISASKNIYTAKTYIYYEKVRIIKSSIKNDRKNKQYSEYFKIKPLKCFSQKNFIFNILEVCEIDKYEFPIINKYDSITEESVTEFIHKNKDHSVISYFKKSKINTIKFQIKVDSSNSLTTISVLDNFIKSTIK